MTKLNKPAIDELMKLINEVKEVQRLVSEFGINYYSHPNQWVATNISEDHTGILHWNKEYIESIDNVNEKDNFTIGACITTGHEHKYKGKYIVAPKKLAETEGEIIKEYLHSIMKSCSPECFELEFTDYGLENNCGWEHFMGITATTNKNALEENEKEKYGIPKSIKEKLNNYELLIFATEEYVRFMYFLESERGYEDIRIKIGDFEYEGWKANMYCILDKEGVYFEHIRDFDGRSWSGKTLTEQLIYAWDFKYIDFNINFDIINNYVKVLNEEEKEIYDSLYEEVHCRFW